ATIQPIVLVTQVIIFANTPSSPWSLAGSLIAGFAVFTLGNLGMFYRCHPDIRLFSRTQLAWLLIPSGSYLAFLSGLSEAPGPGLLGLYLCAQTIAVKQAAGISMGTWRTRFIKWVNTPEVPT
ncbi:MAG TPA: hypothetical protein VH681_08535, partial [Nitrospiraceae bacterium]